MSNVLWANDASSTLAGAITNVATTANLAVGTGVLFPNPTNGDYFCLTFRDAATGLIDEIVHVTARSGDTITMVRAQEGTSALPWSAGDLADNLITAGSLMSLLQSGSQALASPGYVKLSNGLIMQWGTWTGTPLLTSFSCTGGALYEMEGGLAYTAVFLIPFPNALLYADANQIDTGNYTAESAHWSPIDNTSMQIYGSGWGTGVFTMNGYWFALGY